jgi:hypothetical protein
MRLASSRFSIAQADVAHVFGLVLAGDDERFVGEQLRIPRTRAEQRVMAAAIELLIFAHERLVAEIGARRALERDARFRPAP